MPEDACITQWPAGGESRWRSARRRPRTTHLEIAPSSGDNRGCEVARAGHCEEPVRRGSPGDRPITMMHRGAHTVKLLIGLALLAAVLIGVVPNRHRLLPGPPRPGLKKGAFLPRKPIDTGGFNVVLPMLKPWRREATLAEIAEVFRSVGHRDIDELDRSLAHPDLPDESRIVLTLMKAALFLYDGEPDRAGASSRRRGTGSNRTTRRPSSGSTR